MLHLLPNMSSFCPAVSSLFVPDSGRSKKITEVCHKEALGCIKILPPISEGHRWSMAQATSSLHTVPSMLKAQVTSEEQRHPRSHRGFVTLEKPESPAKGGMRSSTSPAWAGHANYNEAESCLCSFILKPPFPPLSYLLAGYGRKS